MEIINTHIDIQKMQKSADNLELAYHFAKTASLCMQESGNEELSRRIRSLSESTLDEWNTVKVQIASEEAYQNAS